MARTMVRRGSHPEAGPLEDPGLGESTFRDSAGEVWTREGSSTSKRKTHRLRTVLILAVVAGALVAGVRYRHQTTHFLDGAASIASSVRRPAQVRVTFNSDPEAVTVERADGTLLGVTPLVTDVPYRDVATEYSFRKAGYLRKTVAFVPDTPSPLFVVMQEAARPPAPAPAAPVVEAPSVTVDPPLARKRPSPVRSPPVEAAPVQVPVQRTAPPVEADPESDGTMAPTEH